MIRRRRGREILPESARGTDGLHRKSRPLFLVFAAAFLVIFGMGLWLIYGGGKTMGSGPAGPSVPRAAFRQPWTTRPVLLLGLGDSITAGFGASEGLSYFERLVTNPPQEFSDMKGINLTAVLPNLTAENRSVSGSTSLEHLEYQIKRLKRADARTLGLVVMTTGGNDLIHNYGRTPPREGAMYGATMEQAKPWIAAFEKRLDTMIRQIEACFPGGCHIFLANIYDPTDGVGDIENAGLPAWKDGREILSAYNRVIDGCARKYDSVHLVNIHDTFLGHGIHCAQPWSRHFQIRDPHYWYYTNLEDPNDRGYDAIRRLFLREMARVSAEIQ